MKTYVAKPGELEKKWIVIDGEGLVVGRLATLIAMRLKGKHRASYTPHVDTGDNVIVINAEKVVFTGNKTTDKIYYRHTGYPGGIKQRSPQQLFASRHPERTHGDNSACCIFTRTFRRVQSGAARLHRIAIYIGAMPLRRIAPYDHCRRPHQRL